MEEAIHFAATKGSAEKAERRKNGNGFRSSRGEKGKGRGGTRNWCKQKSGKRNLPRGEWGGRGSNLQKCCPEKFAAGVRERERWLQFAGTVESVKIENTGGNFGSREWSVRCSGVGRRRGGARDEEIWKGISVGFEENGAAIGNGWGEEEPWVARDDG